jgi:hypothetical protein
LLRLKLLITYGGTWIDSTVFCSTTAIPDFMLNSELFLFQTLKPGVDGHPTAISNWFITAEVGNDILRLTYQLLLSYWKTHDYAIDYFIFHYFFQIAIETFPNIWKKVVPVTNEQPHVLLLHWNEPYDQEFYNSILKLSPFHKLTYKVKPELKQKQGTIYRFFENN